MDNSFQLGGKNFKLSKIDAFKQFHIVRRIGPILSEMLSAMKDIQKVSKDDQLESVAKIAAPIMNGLSKLSDADSELVMFGLLSAVEMQQASGNWARVSTGSMLMIQDMELPVMLQLAGRAFMFNLSSFFSALPQ